MTRRCAPAWMLAAALTAATACDADTPRSPTSPTTAAPTPTSASAPVTTSVRVECASTIVNGRKITCQATAEVSAGSSAAGVGASRPLATVNVTANATWNSSNPAVARVTNGEIEALSVGVSTISAAYQGVTGRADVEVKPNEAQITDAAYAKYTVNGRLESNTCAGTDPLREYVGEIEVQRAGESAKPVQLTYGGRVQRLFRSPLTPNVVNGDVQLTSEILMQPFGASSPVTSSRIYGTLSTTGSMTTMTEEMTCMGGGLILFRIDSRKFF